MINGTCLRNAIISGANNIAKHKTSVDELNIFPVPDGDTGTNMSMTMSSAVAALEKNESDAVGQVASACASALLRGARGNSGVILSLLFRGFAQGLKDLDVMDGSHIATALGIGVEAAYKAVMKPTEGTILTVARVAYEEGRAAAEENKDPVFVWTAICQGATDALRTTPELLPVLKKAGVVDAGGKGLCLIFEGMMSVFKDGYIIPNEQEAASGAVSKPVSSDDFFRNAAAEFDQDITFTYCTEFIVGRNPEITASPLELRAYLETIGDCVVVVDDDEIIKTHVHTENPGQALQEALKFGQLLTVKVEKLKNENLASIITLSEEGRRMQDMMKMYAMGGMGGMDPNMFAADQTLTLNANHALVKYIFEHKDSENVPMFCEQLYDLAMLSNQPLSVDAMSKFVERSNKIMMLLAK